MQGLIRAFADDAKVQALLVLIALDFVLGVLAALKAGTFRLNWISDFLRSDVLGKVVPYFCLWAAAVVSGDIEIPGIDFGLLEDGAFTVAVAAMAASILNSLRDFGLAKLPDEVAGPDVPPPVPPPPPG